MKDFQFFFPVPVMVTSTNESQRKTITLWFAWGTKKQITFLISSGVPIRKTINTYHVSWVNQLFLWPFSSSQTVSVPEANSKNIFSKSREFSSGKSPRYIKKIQRLTLGVWRRQTYLLRKKIHRARFRHWKIPTQWQKQLRNPNTPQQRSQQIPTKLHNITEHHQIFWNWAIKYTPIPFHDTSRLIGFLYGFLNHSTRARLLDVQLTLTFCQGSLFWFRWRQG